MHTVSLIGLGYIGLPTAALVASRGFNVLGCDINPNVVEAINNAQSHIVEPGLEDLIHEGVTNGTLKAYTSPQAADVYVIAVPTPFQGDHQPDVSYVMAAAKSIAPLLKSGDLVILESTSPVGTTHEMADLLTTLRPDLKIGMDNKEGDIYTAYCPERIIPGFALEELVNNDRVVGGLTPQSTQKAIDFYKSVDGQCIPTDANTAEMAKLTENSFRDVNIAFANELSILCDKMGINVYELIKLANHHPRVNILTPGPGVGGHCIAVDPWFIVASYPEDANLIRTARITNDNKPKYVVSKVIDALGSTQDKSIALFGLAFKPDIDDLRESPAIEIAESLAKNDKAKTIAIVEPHIDELPQNLRQFNKVRLSSIKDAIESSDIMVMLVSHSQFKHIDLGLFKNKKVFDFQGIWTR